MASDIVQAAKANQLAQLETLLGAPDVAVGVNAQDTVSLFCGIVR